MTKAMTLRLPDDLHEGLRQEAFDRRTSITAVIIERLSAAVQAAGVRCDSCSKGLHAGCQGHRVECSCGCGDASDGGRLG